MPMAIFCAPFVTDRKCFIRQVGTTKSCKKAVDSFVVGLLTNRETDDLIIIWSLRFLHGFHEGPGIWMSLVEKDSRLLIVVGITATLLTLPTLSGGHGALHDLPRQL